MLSFYHQVSGGQVAREIADDEEELAEMLKELAEYEASQFEEVRDYLDVKEAAAIATLLRGLADLLEA